MTNIEYPRILPAADCSVVVEFGNVISTEINTVISGFVKAMSERSIDGVIEVIPTFRSALVTYNPRHISYNKLCNEINDRISNMDVSDNESRRTIEIPVCYGGEFGPDLSFVAAHSGMSEEEVVALHSSKSYLIYMLGFQPGFPYLGGLDPKLFTPRLSSPRSLIPAGSVGIGGEQTGLYPVASPAGWQIIGTTPVKAYNPHRTPAIPYEAGDHIKFIPISVEEFHEIELQEKTNSYQFNIVTN